MLSKPTTCRRQAGSYHSEDKQKVDDRDGTTLIRMISTKKPYLCCRKRLFQKQLQSLMDRLKPVLKAREEFQCFRLPLSGHRSLKRPFPSPPHPITSPLFSTPPPSPTSYSPAPSSLPATPPHASAHSPRTSPPPPSSSPPSHAASKT